jgi:hypothetical protein
LRAGDNRDVLAYVTIESDSAAHLLRC